MKTWLQGLRITSKNSHILQEVPKFWQQGPTHAHAHVMASLQKTPTYFNINLTFLKFYSLTNYEENMQVSQMSQSRQGIRILLSHYTKSDIQCFIIFSVVTTLSCSTLIFNSLIISVRHKCTANFPTATSFLLLLLLTFFSYLVQLLVNLDHHLINSHFIATKGVTHTCTILCKPHTWCPWATLFQ